MGKQKTSCKFMKEWNTIHVVLEVWYMYLLLFAYRLKIFMMESGFAVKNTLSERACAQYSSLDPGFLNTTYVPSAAELVP